MTRVTVNDTFGVVLFCVLNKEGKDFMYVVF